MEKYLKIAKQAALAAKPVLIDNFGKIKKSDIVEKRLNDFLTFVDEQAEKKIIATIKDKFPSHTILAEESGRDKNDSDFQWIIDPLDGTKNYISGVPVFAVSIALSIKNEIVAGVIYDPMRDDMYHAIKDQGAFINDIAIHVSSQQNIENCLVATGFPFKRKGYIKPYLSCFEEIFNNISGMRRMGAAALDLAYVASGRFEAFWELGLSPWDIAAGLLIVKEAGGQVSDFWGKTDYLPNDYFIATNGHIHQKMLSIIKNHFRKYSPLKGSVKISIKK
jgi:myo-inositol-1(or 4)-monophosphatase